MNPTIPTAIYGPERDGQHSLSLLLTTATLAKCGCLHSSFLGDYVHTYVLLLKSITFATFAPGVHTTPGFSSPKNRL